jgi:hypothetical protein
MVHCAGLPLDRTAAWRILVEGEVRLVVSVVVDERVEQAAQVALVEDNDVVE